MPNNDSHHHVVKTTEQWQDRAVEYWVVPRGTLCVELTPEKKTKIKIGEGSKYYSQLPYICDGHDMSNYYTKEETDRLLDNLNRMAIQSTDVYDTEDDLPSAGNRLGDVRFVRSTSEQKVDPDVYLWNGSKWIYVGYDFANIDLDRYLTKTEFHSEFDPVRDKVDEMYPKMHTHDNKDVLDRTERPFTIADKEKLDSLENYDDTEIRELIRETGHVHWNKHILDTITEDKLWTVQDREKFESLHNYDDTELRNRMGVVESKAHTHTNKDILDQTTAPFKTEDKQKLDSLENYDIFIGTDGRYPGVKGLVPAPSTLDIGTFLSSDGTWKKAGFDSDFVGATPYMDGEHGLVPAPLMGEQSYFLRGDGTWAKVKSEGDKYKAGEGIYILSGEVATDTFPFKVYSRSGHLEQYIIYGNTGGVGDAMTGGVYGVNITITDEHGNSSNTSVILPEKISLGDYIDYGRQVFVHMRTNVSSLLGNIDPSYNWRWAIRPDGSIQYTDIGAFGSAPQVTSLVELEPGVTYELYHKCTYTQFTNYMNLNVYDTEQNRTRTINFYDTTGTVPTIIALTSNEKYIRVTYGPLPQIYSYTLIRVKAVETPITLPQIPLFPNSINTINVTNTIKPAEIYVEVAEPSEDDPDDPMSDFTGIIYNDGVLDVTQEDPNALNELTVHFRDDVDKTITIPSASVMEGATDQTDGEEGLVPAPLAGDENKFLRGDGTWAIVESGVEYIAGNHINFSREGDDLPAEYTRVEYIESAENATVYLDTGYNGNTGFTAVLDLQYYPSSHRQLMGIQPGTGNYFGSNADEHFEMGSGVHTASDTTQRNTVTWHHTLTSSAKLEWNGSYVTDQDGYGGYDENFKLFSPFSDYKSQLKIYSCIMYDNNDQVVRNFIPCKTALGVPGFYDTVTEQFYSGQPASLIAGPVVPPSGPTAINADEMVGADGTNDGEAGVVPTPLASDNTKFLRGDGTWAEVSGGGTEYVAGQGIEFENDSETYLFAENLYMLSNTPIDTGIIPSGSYDFHIEIQFKRIGTPGFLIICYNGEQGSFSYQPGYGRSWIYRAHEDWVDLYGTTAPSNSICTVDLKWGRNMTMQILPNGTYYSKTTSYDPTNVCHVLLNSANGNESYVYYVKMWDGDTLVGDLVPCVRQSDNATGFFNKVDNTFHTNTSGPAIAHGTLTGESYEVVAPTSINAKLGNGLQFDANEAIEAIPYVAGTGIDIESYAPARLPVEYQEVEYIASDGVTQNYINTGIHQPMTVVLDMKYNTNATQQYMGWSITGKNRYFGVDNYSKYNLEETPGAVTGIDLDVTERRKITVSFRTGQASTMTIEGETITNFTTEGSDVYTTNDFLLFTLDKTDYFSNATIYEVTIYDTNFQPIFHGIPCYRVSDNVSGLYDLVSETFKPSIGGNLAVGPDVVPNNSYKIINTGLLSVEQDQLDPGHLTFETIDGDIDVNIPNNTYAAGAGIEFTAPGMTDLGFDFDAFVATITSINNGTKTVDSEHEVLTLTATGDDCYTKPYTNTSVQNVYTFPIVAGHVYRLTWDSSNPSVPGRIFAFENVSETNLHQVDQSVQDYLEFTAVTSGTINFRFGVQNSGDTISYSNIHFYEMDDFDPNTTIINADIGKGLEFDTSDKTQVKLSNGLHFDSNNAIEVQPATENSIGGIKVGEGLSVSQDGTLDVVTDVITTFAEGDAIEFGTTPVPLTESITHIKWAINTIRNRSLNIIQASEIEFYDENDQLLTFSAVSGAFSPSVSTRPIYGTNQYSQTPDKLVDGSTAYKCCCTNFTSSIPEIEFTFELSTPINAQDLKNYRWFTADDQEGRDPISWEVYVSPNGGDWICVHEVTNATVPTARQTSTEYYTVNKPSFGERTINVKYGAGLRLDANGALEVVPGGGLTAGHGIEIDQTNHINNKLGVGLTFDSDDAVTLDETTDLIFNCDYSE